MGVYWLEPKVESNDVKPGICVLKCVFDVSFTQICIADADADTHAYSMWTDLKVL